MKWLNLLLPVAVLVAAVVVVLILISGGDDDLVTIHPPGWEGDGTSAGADGDVESTPTPSDDGEPTGVPTDGKATATPSGDGDGDSTVVPPSDGNDGLTGSPGPSTVEEFLAPYGEELIVKSACVLSGNHREVDCAGAGAYRLEPPPEGDRADCVSLHVDGDFFGVACSPQGSVSITEPDTVFYVLPR